MGRFKKLFNFSFLQHVEQSGPYRYERVNYIILFPEGLAIILILDENVIMLLKNYVIKKAIYDMCIAVNDMGIPAVHGLVQLAAAHALLHRVVGESPTRWRAPFCKSVGEFRL